LLLRHADESEAREVVARIIDAVESNIDPLVRMLKASFGIATSGGRRNPKSCSEPLTRRCTRQEIGTRIEVAA
jgi:hypothetical protein